MPTSSTSSIAQPSSLFLLRLSFFIFLFLPIVRRIMCYCVLYELIRALPDSYFQKEFKVPVFKQLVPREPCEHPGVLLRFIERLSAGQPQ